MNSIVYWEIVERTCQIYTRTNLREALSELRPGCTCDEPDCELVERYGRFDSEAEAKAAFEECATEFYTYPDNHLINVHELWLEQVECEVDDDGNEEVVSYPYDWSKWPAELSFGRRDYIWNERQGVWFEVLEEEYWTMDSCTWRHDETDGPLPDDLEDIIDEANVRINRYAATHGLDSDDWEVKEYSNQLWEHYCRTGELKNEEG